MDFKNALTGNWSGLCDKKLHDSFLEIDICQDENVCYMILRDRHYRESPKSELNLLEENGFAVTFPHWIINATVTLRGKLEGDELKVFIDRQGMTGLKSYSVTLTKYGTDLELFRKPSTRALDHTRTPSPLISKILTEYAGSSSEPLRPRIEAMLLMKDGQVAMEEYFWGMTDSTFHMISSCTKSIVAILAGIAIDQGLFSLHDSIAKHFPWVEETSWRDEPPITVHHVLSMTAGTEHTLEDSQKLLVSSDIEAFTLASKRVVRPGTRYHYDNSLPSLIGCLIERKSGLPLHEFAARYLFKPLELQAPLWTFTPLSTSKVPPPAPDSDRALASGGLYMTLRDFTKIGSLFLQGGVYNGQRIVSREYLDSATRQQTPKSEYPYGYYIHLNESGGRQQPWLSDFKGYLALGQGEQILAVSPKDRVLIAAFSATWHKEPLNSSKRLNVAGNHANDVLPAWVRASGRNPTGRNFTIFECLNEFGTKNIVQAGSCMSPA